MQNYVVSFRESWTLSTGSPKMRGICLLEKFWKLARKNTSLFCYDKVGKIFHGNVLQRLLKYEYFANYKQKQYKIYIISNTGNFATFFHEVLTSKVHTKDVRKANSFRVFDKILSKLCWGHLPFGDVIFFKSWRSADLNLEEAFRSGIRFLVWSFTSHYCDGWRIHTNQS
jgi:hypothetical protein